MEKRKGEGKYWGNVFYLTGSGVLLEFKNLLLAFSKSLIRFVL